MSLFGSPDYASMAAKNEKNRQGIINLGMKQLDAIFGGGSAPFYSVPTGKFDPTKNYFSQGKSGEFAPYWLGAKGAEGKGSITSPFQRHPDNSFGGGVFDFFRGDNGGWYNGGPIGLISGLFDDAPSPKDLAKGEFRKGRLFTEKDQTFEGFQPDFFNQRATDYTNYALPQLATQYRATKNSLGFGLANRGLYNGSASAKQMSDLERETGQAKQVIAEAGQNQKNTLRQQVEAAKQAAITQLYQTADPSQASAGAVARAADFKMPYAFAPLANMFSSLLSKYQTSSILNPSGGVSPYAMAPNYSVTGSALPGVTI